MGMREQPVGVRRVRRGDTKPADAYDILVDGQFAGWVERQHLGKRGSAWRAYRDGQWPRTFDRGSGFVDAVEWLTSLHRAARPVAEPVRVLSPVAADPFRGDPFADPLVP